MMKNIDIKYLKDNNLIVFETVSGSHAHGTNTPESDTDIRGIFMLDIDSILGIGYVDQVSDQKNDVTYYEIRRFLELLQANNPNIIELLGSPDDCILYKDPIMDELFDRAGGLLTKQCKNTFGGYAISQIRKARGLNKKMNWEVGEMSRKTVLDFCYILKNDGNGSLPLKKWIYSLNERARERLGKNFSWEYTQKSFGLSKIDHARDCYGIYDIVDEPEYRVNPDYAGIVSNEDLANDVQLTSFSKNAKYLGILTFNKDGYSSHCKRYAEYQTWLKERNPNRVRMNKTHGKNYDGKNMSHTLRLLIMAKEIAEGKGIVVRRNKDEVKRLLSVKRGEYEFENLLSEADNLMKEIDELYSISHLPETVDAQIIDDILVNMRRNRYGLNSKLWSM